MSKPTTIEEVLIAVSRFWKEDASPGENVMEVPEALAAIEQLVLGRVIEPDECVYQINRWGHGERVKGYADKVVRNRNRAEQRQALKQLLGGER